VDTILDKESFTLEELLDEDEIIQECKALNTRLINFLRDRAQVEQLLRYIVEEAPEDAEKKRAFKFPFIACEIFTCEVDIILRTLVEDEEDSKTHRHEERRRNMKEGKEGKMKEKVKGKRKKNENNERKGKKKVMNLLFSFLKPDHPHSTLLAGYFSKGHPEIIHQLIDLIGITSIMEVLIRLIGADENMYSNYVDTMRWLEDTDVLEMIVDKFSSSDSAEVHANASEILCAITRYAPPGLAAKICSPSFVGRLFRHALEDLRPKSVLVHSLSVCISLLDPKRLLSSSYQSFRSQLSHGTMVAAGPETVDGMLESLGDLLKLLDVSSSESILPTTYGKLQPPLGKHRLKIVEFISVLLTIGSASAEKELIRLGAIKCVIDLFFEYPYNNFLHHHVENIVVSCLESKNTPLIEHLLHDCDVVGKILAAEKQPTLSMDLSKPTVSAQGKSPPRIGSVGHMTRIANKLCQFGNDNSLIQTYLQENSEWVEWHASVLAKRNAVENVYQWACGRPTSLQDRGRDSDDEDFRDRDYDVAALASNLSQAFRYGIYSNDDIEEDVYFDDESAEVVISSLRLGDDQDSSLFTNSNWFAFEDDKAVHDRSTGSLASPSPNSDDTTSNVDAADEVVVAENDDLIDNKTCFQVSELSTTPGEPESVVLANGPVKESKEDFGQSSINEVEKPPGWVEWRETSESGDMPDINRTSGGLNGELEQGEDEHSINEVTSDVGKCLSSSGDAEKERHGDDADGSPGSTGVVAINLPESGNPCANSSESSNPVNGDVSSESPTSEDAVEDAEHEKMAVENLGN
ncbi:serine/threonine-protein phosphatase 6 regulatory subunit 3, partial [Cocos nucifera]